jgi:hypothetical protein
VVPQVITSALAPPVGEIFQQKSEIIGISVDFYGFPKTYRVRWVPLNFYAFLWVPMDFYGFLWIPGDCSGFLRTSMDF